MVFVIARGYITKEGIDKTVWSVRFFDFVAEEVSSATGLCHLMWKGAWGAYQDPNTVVMSSRKMRAWLLDDPPFAKHYLAMKTDKAKVGCLRDGMQNKTTLNGKKYASYLKQFKDFIKAPRDYAKEQDFNFADIMSWQTSFHILEPIKNEAYVRSLLGRLRYSGLPLNEVKCRALLPHSPSGNDGKDEMEEEEAPATDQYFLYKCSCGRYRHYAWCLHVMCRAVYDDLVWKPYRPKTMDSAKVLSVRKCGGAPAESGRHAKARKGGALDKRQ